MSILRGDHQFGIGANYIYSQYDPQSYTSAAGNTTFTGAGDRPGPGRLHAGPGADAHGRHAYGCEDAIQLLRDVHSGQLARVVERDGECRPQVGSRTCRLTADQARLRISIRRDSTPDSRVRSSSTPRQDSSSRVTRGCRGSRSPGAISGTSRRASASVWDPQGEGLETLRLAYGRLYDMPHLQTYTGLAQMSPWGNAITLNSFPKGWDEPWAATPGRRSDSNAPPGAERELGVPAPGHLHAVPA